MTDENVNKTIDLKKECLSDVSPVSLDSFFKKQQKRLNEIGKEYKDFLYGNQNKLK